ncbi:MAG TPA: LysM domain-containing protein [Candidatus Limnocylindrales bacterium]|nr:LysM domain-containing protein [Candidatus Limnocylindrales bacterium]
MRRLLWLVLAISLALPLLVMAAPPAIPAGEACGPGVVHVVRYGENVYRISLRYGTTVRAIVNANALANPNVIYAGQSLLIPCASGSVPPAGPTPTPAPVFVILPGQSSISVALPGSGSVFVPPPVSAVDCRNFRPTSPTDGIGRGQTTFYWDAASWQVQWYRVNVFNMDTSATVVASYATSGPFTHVTGDTGVGALGEGFRFAWNVEAFADGRRVCSSVLVFLNRTSS